MNRRLLSLGLVASAVLVLVFEGDVRQAEAGTAALVADRVFGLDTFVNPLHPALYVTAATDPEPTFGALWVGLMVTRECTVAWLLAPLLVLSAAMVLGRRLTVAAVAAAVVLAGAALVAVNLTRLLVITLATHHWGLDTGYRWSHDVYGSLVGVVGVGLATVLFLVTATRLSNRSGVGAAARARV